MKSFNKPLQNGFPNFWIFDIYDIYNFLQPKGKDQQRYRGRSTKKYFCRFVLFLDLLSILERKYAIQF